MKTLGLTKENAFGCIADYLFRPTIGARRYINAYRELFSLKSVLSIGIQVFYTKMLVEYPNRNFISIITFRFVPMTKLWLIPKMMTIIWKSGSITSNVQTNLRRQRRRLTIKESCTSLSQIRIPCVMNSKK